MGTYEDLYSRISNGNLKEDTRKWIDFINYFNSFDNISFKELELRTYVIHTPNPNGLRITLKFPPNFESNGNYVPIIIEFPQVKWKYEIRHLDKNKEPELTAFEEVQRAMKYLPPLPAEDIDQFFEVDLEVINTLVIVELKPFYTVS